MSIIMNMKQEPPRHDAVPGKCAKCERQVYESLAVLDDAYNVWLGECPFCGALNFLSLRYGLRGYDSSWMELVLPFDEEVAENNLPEDTWTRGSSGSPANIRGSNLGEMCAKLRGE